MYLSASNIVDLDGAGSASTQSLPPWSSNPTQLKVPMSMDPALWAQQQRASLALRAQAMGAGALLSHSSSTSSHTTSPAERGLATSAPTMTSPGVNLAPRPSLVGMCPPRDPRRFSYQVDSALHAVPAGGMDTGFARMSAGRGMRGPSSSSLRPADAFRSSGWSPLTRPAPYGSTLSMPYRDYVGSSAFVPQYADGYIDYHDYDQDEHRDPSSYRDTLLRAPIQVPLHDDSAEFNDFHFEDFGMSDHEYLHATGATHMPTEPLAAPRPRATLAARPTSKPVAAAEVCLPAVLCARSMI